MDVAAKKDNNKVAIFCILIHKTCFQLDQCNSFIFEIFIVSPTKKVDGCIV